MNMEKELLIWDIDYEITWSWKYPFITWRQQKLELVEREHVKWYNTMFGFITKSQLYEYTLSDYHPINHTRLEAVMCEMKYDETTPKPVVLSVIPSEERLETAEDIANEQGVR